MEGFEGVLGWVDLRIWKNLRDYARLFDANRVLTGSMRKYRIVGA